MAGVAGTVGVRLVLPLIVLVMAEGIKPLLMRWALMSSAAAMLGRCFLLARGLVVSPGSDMISRGAGSELENRGGDDAEPLSILALSEDGSAS